MAANKLCLFENGDFGNFLVRVKAKAINERRLHHEIICQIREESRPKSLKL